VATLQNLLKLPAVLDQQGAPGWRRWTSSPGSATTNPFMADLERANQVIRDISRTRIGWMPGAQLKGEHVVPIEAWTCPFSDGADRCP
jgi:hypothetical protein